VAWHGAKAGLDWGPYHFGQDLEAGKQILRTLFVQAARTVLQKRMSWERYGLPRPKEERK
jgi:hypothetical protein